MDLRRRRRLCRLPSLPQQPPPPKNIAVQTDIKIVGRSGFPFEDDDFDSRSMAGLFEISAEMQTLLGRHACRHALAWMMDMSVFGAEQSTRVFTVKDLPDFVSHLCSRSDELECERELTNDMGPRLDKLEARLEMARRTTPSIASLFDDGEVFDRRVQREFEELAAMKKARQAQIEAAHCD